MPDKFNKINHLTATSSINTFIGGRYYLKYKEYSISLIDVLQVTAGAADGDYQQADQYIDADQFSNLVKLSAR